ncbi:MAG: hypothetical protein Q6L68_09860, partial [Thermostichus sp. DG02_5_bins_236]
MKSAAFSNFAALFLESWLIRAGYLTPEQLAQAREYQQKAYCSLPRALWSLQQMHPSKFVRLWSGFANRPTLWQWLKQHPLDPELIWLVESTDLLPVRFLPCGWAGVRTRTLVVAAEEPGHPEVRRNVQRLFPEVKVWEIPATEQQILS